MGHAGDRAESRPGQAPPERRRDTGRNQLRDSLGYFLSRVVAASAVILGSLAGRPPTRVVRRPTPASAPAAEIAAVTRSAMRTPWLTAAGEAKLPAAANTVEAIAIPKARLPEALPEAVGR